ncbi:MarR family winged helix-turn-helix transcriptional regulator [Devosia aquimaris]|uniref:MarR family winged helix-turn-helix transcriptional regulator n=1 Tax=Devosia aquimaris TaxID=2866214 RepID=UPI001CD137BB|nr:MarR family transcriptional regulator [Devosia sp. CJK-A8-3]
MTELGEQERAVGTLMADVSRLLRRRFEDEAKPFGVTLPQWKALSTIQKQDSITQVALSAHLEIDAMTLSGILDRLEKRGLIERFVHPEDSRAKLTRLTASGQALVKQTSAIGTTVFEQAIRGLSPDDLTALGQHLAHVRANLISSSQDIAETGKAS